MRLITCAAGCVMLLSASARADFVMQAPAAPPAEPSVMTPRARPVARILHRVAPVKPPIAEAEGTGLPLWAALRLVVPPDVRTEFTSDVEPDQLVDVHGGKSWPDVVQETLAPLHLKATGMPKVVKVELVKESGD